MSIILMSIKPKYVDKILSGDKKYEFRKIMPKRNGISKIIIYSSFPIMRIVGEVEILEIICEYKDILWQITKEKSGITKDEFDKYFINCKKGIAYKLGNVKKYKQAYKLSEIGINYAPQSFIYLDDLVVKYD